MQSWKESTDPMNFNNSVWFDPSLHLPRAPVLRHNVSLCHGRTTLPSFLFSPSTTPAASPDTLTRSRVYGILDFGNSVARMAQLNDAGRIGPLSGRKYIGEDGGRQFFIPSPRTLPLSSSLHRSGAALSSIFSSLRFLNQRANPRLREMQSGMSRKKISSRYCHVASVRVYTTFQCIDLSQNNNTMLYQWLWEINVIRSDVPNSKLLLVYKSQLIPGKIVVCIKIENYERNWQHFITFRFCWYRK